jgi:hypothetical protein
MIGKKMALVVLVGLRRTGGLTYRRQKKRNPKKTDRTRTLIDSAFWKTFTMQYRNAATHKNHSRSAASMTVPMMAT